MVIHIKIETIFIVRVVGVSLAFIPWSNLLLLAYQNVVYGNMDQFDKEADEAHDQKADSCGLGDVCEFLSVGLGALFDQMHRVFCKLLQRLNEHFVETFFFHFVMYRV